MAEVEVLLEREIDADVVERILRVAYADNAERRAVRMLADRAGKEDVSKKVLKVLKLWFAPAQEEAYEAAKGMAKRDEALAYLYLRLCMALEKTEEALTAMAKHKKKYKCPLPFALLKADALARMGRLEESETILNGVKKGLEETEDGDAWHMACLSLVEGYLAERRGLWEQAMECYSRTIQSAPDIHRAHYRIAYLYDLHGEDELAIRHYEQAKRLRPLHVNTLINLGVLYEDAGWFRRAAGCYETVLAKEPLHPRARLYLRDAKESLRMYYDEEKEVERRRLRKLLATSISDFELSVRSRNCLQKMNIRTLGDLVQRTEQELLSYKNFGETSLSEIKQLLAVKGLRLGMKFEKLLEQVPVEVTRSSPPAGWEDEGVLRLPVGKLQLSVRARRCLDAIGVKVLGELIQKSDHELLSQRNFGQTSLAEVKEQLAKYGLTLRSSD